MIRSDEDFLKHVHQEEDRVIERRQKIYRTVKITVANLAILVFVVAIGFGISLLNSTGKGTAMSGSMNGMFPAQGTEQNGNEEMVQGSAAGSDEGYGPTTEVIRSEENYTCESNPMQSTEELGDIEETSIESTEEVTAESNDDATTDTIGPEQDTEEQTTAEYDYVVEIYLYDSGTTYRFYDISEPYRSKLCQNYEMAMGQGEHHNEKLDDWSELFVRVISVDGYDKFYRIYQNYYQTADFYEDTSPEEYYSLEPDENGKTPTEYIYDVYRELMDAALAGVLTDCYCKLETVND